MRNLVQTLPENILAAHHGDLDACGLLTSPTQFYDVEKAVSLGMAWALDNACFKRYDPAAIVRMLRKFAGLPGCLFMVAPDKVCDHTETLRLFWEWEAIIASYGYPIAFVLQNEVSLETVPWGHIDAIFIGGDTNFKFSKTVTEICKEAKKRGLYIHLGRVNSIDRIGLAHRLGCHSFDGTGYSRLWKTRIPKHYHRTKGYYSKHYKPPKQYRMEL